MNCSNIMWYFAPIINSVKHYHCGQLYHSLLIFYSLIKGKSNFSPPDDQIHISPTKFKTLKNLISSWTFPKIIEGTHVYSIEANFPFEYIDHQARYIEDSTAYVGSFLPTQDTSFEKLKQPPRTIHFPIPLNLLQHDSQIPPLHALMVAQLG